MYGQVRRGDQNSFDQLENRQEGASGAIRWPGAGGERSPLVDGSSSEHLAEFGGNPTGRGGHWSS